MNILDVRNHDSGNMETGIPEWEPPLIGLYTIDKKLFVFYIIANRFPNNRTV